MKCIKNSSGVIRRVSNDQAEKRIRIGDWIYVPKSAWKTKGTQEEFTQQATTVVETITKTAPSTPKKDRRKSRRKLREANKSK